MANKNPLVSVYITNYNYGKYIRQSVESLLEQTLQDFELFIIDDGSTDESRKIIEEYAEFPNVSIIYQRNKGLNITNNIALRVSRGKYIMRLDADDYLVADALETMSNVLEADDELGLVFPDYYLVDGHGVPIGEVRRFNFKNEVSLLDQPAHGACTMIRRDFLVNLGGYDESYSCQDGYELWIKFISHYKVLNINKPLFSYRQHGNNLTTNETKILETRFRIKDNFIANNNIDTPSTIAIIPVRPAMLKGKKLAFLEIKGEPLLTRTVKAALASKKLNKIIVTSSDDEVKSFFEKEFGNIEDARLLFLERPAEFERINETLNKTIDFVVDQANIVNVGRLAIMTLTLEYPFLNGDMIDDAVNTLTIFGADSLISVRPDNSIYYQHDGSGLNPILQLEKFTKLEREALYKGVGGIVISTLENYRSSGKMLTGKIGHIVIGQEQALGVFSEFDLKICNAIANNVTSFA